MKLLASGAIYVVAYLLFMLPTYALPYLGSNSAVINTIAVAGAGKTYPLFWYHATSLAVLFALALLRGPYVGRRWLWVFPALAAFFDLVPGINLIPLAPTLLHVFAIVLGVMDAKKVVGDAEAAPPRPSRTEAMLALGAVGGFVAMSIVTTLAFGPAQRKPGGVQATTAAARATQALPAPPVRTAAPTTVAAPAPAAAPPVSLPTAAPAPAGPTRYAGVVDKMTVEALLEHRGDGTVAGYWQVTNRPKLAGIRYRLEGTRQGDALVLREFSQANAHEMDVQLRADPATGELVGLARNRTPGATPWAVRLKPAA